jgi:hypothetical protein
MRGHGGLIVSAQIEEWFVSDGEAVFGPMPRARAREAIAQPNVAWVRLAEWDAWRAPEEVPELGDEEASGIRKTGDAVVAARELAMVISAPSLREASLHVLRAAASHLGCSVGLLHLIERRAVSTCLAAGTTARAPKTSDAVLVELRRARYVCGHARTHARLAAAAGVPAKDVIALPLRARGELVGAIELAAGETRGAFDSRDVAFVEQLAAGLSLAPR